MTTNSIRKLLTLPLVPLIAVLSAYLLRFLQEHLVAFMADLMLHDECYVVPDLRIYAISSLIIGFLPAILLRRVTGLILATIASPLRCMNWSNSN